MSRLTLSLYRMTVPLSLVAVTILKHHHAETLKFTIFEIAYVVLPSFLIISAEGEFAFTIKLVVKEIFLVLVTIMHD